MNSIYKATESFEIFSLSNVKRIQVMYAIFKLLSLKIYLLRFFEIGYYSFVEFIASIYIFPFLKLLFKIIFSFNGGAFPIPRLINTAADIYWSLYYGRGRNHICEQLCPLGQVYIHGSHGIRTRNISVAGVTAVDHNAGCTVYEMLNL